MLAIKTQMENVGLTIDIFGVAIIVFGVIYCSVQFVTSFRDSAASSYRQFRQGIGKAVLLGLELLVAGDIIRTVAVTPNLENVSVLALIVLIRTFLSMSLQIELDGKLPWRAWRASRNAS